MANSIRAPVVVARNHNENMIANCPGRQSTTFTLVRCTTLPPKVDLWKCAAQLEVFYVLALLPQQSS